MKSVPMKRDDTHELISPSSFKALTGCPGRLIVHREDTDERNEPAIWGSRCHALAEHWLKTGILNYHGVMMGYAEAYPEQYDYEPTTPADEEMIDTAKMYVDYCKGLGEGETSIEKKIMLCDDCGGTADFTHASDTVLTVVDLKGGAGVEVFAEENEQMMIYAAAVAGEEIDFYDTIRLVIVQPRVKTGPSIKIWETTPGELMTWVEETCLVTIEKITDMLVTHEVDEELSEENISTLDREGYLCASLESCRWCSGKAVCPAALRTAMSAAIEDFSEFTDGLVDGEGSAPLSINTAGLDVLANASLIRKILDAVEAFANKELQAGREIPGFKLVNGRKSKSWINGAEAEAWLKSKKFKLPEMYSSKLVSPAAAITLVKGRRFAKDLDAFYTINAGKPTMVPESDAREEYKPTTAEDDFAEFVKE